MNNENLKKGVKTQFRSGEEAAAYGVKGGIISGEVRRKKRTMKRAAQMLLDLRVSNEGVAQKMLDYGLDEANITNQMAIMVAMVNQATRGNVRAATFLRDTVGEKPTEKVEVLRPIDESVAELDALLKKMDDDGKRNVSKADKK